MSDPYTRSQEERIRAALAAGPHPSCPVCDTLLEVTDIPPRRDVAYVRRRRWLHCGGCGRSLVVERTRSPGG